jgi:hypothetical protein
LDAYPKIRTIEALSEKRLSVVFSDGTARIYDCKPLLDEPVFQPLRDEAVFQSVRADPHGFGVIWNDDIDLAESELWINGTLQGTAEAGLVHSQP